MKSRKALNELLSLSKAHLQSVMEENWDAWERIFETKKRHYETLNDLVTKRFGPEEMKTLSEIKALERQTTAALIEKREQARMETIEMKRVRQGVRGYRKGKPQRDQRHFNVKI